MAAGNGQSRGANANYNRQLYSHTHTHADNDPSILCTNWLQLFSFDYFIYTFLFNAFHWLHHVTQSTDFPPLFLVFFECFPFFFCLLAVAQLLKWQHELENLSTTTRTQWERVAPPGRGIRMKEWWKRMGQNSILYNALVQYLRIRRAAVSATVDDDEWTRPSIALRQLYCAAINQIAFSNVWLCMLAYGKVYHSGDSDAEYKNIEYWMQVFAVIQVSGEVNRNKCIYIHIYILYTCTFW